MADRRAVAQALHDAVAHCDPLVRMLTRMDDADADALVGHLLVAANEMDWFARRIDQEARSNG